MANIEDEFGSFGDDNEIRVSTVYIVFFVAFSLWKLILNRKF